MTLTELQAEVITLTNRPDRVAETLAAVRAATLKAHNSDYYYKDLYETGIAFLDPLLFLQQIEYQTLIPRWRSLKYLRKFDATGTPAPGTPGKFFDILLPELVLDNYSINREDICYIAGSTLQIRSSTKLANALIGIYLNPDISVLNYTSWIAINQPWAIIYDAASTVFKMIGKSEDALSFKTLRDEQYAELKISYIIANGY